MSEVYCVQYGDVLDTRIYLTWAEALVAASKTINDSDNARRISLVRGNSQDTCSKYGFVDVYNIHEGSVSYYITIRQTIRN